MSRGGRSRSRARRARRSLGRRFLASWVGCCAIVVHVCVCVLYARWCSYLRGAAVASSAAVLVWIPGAEGRRACICARALAMLVRGGACYHRSTVVRVSARAIARACACALLASARVFGRRRSCRTELAPSRLLRGRLHLHARRCGPLVASRHSGDLKNTTNTHLKSLERPPVAFEPRRHHFWLVVILFFAREVNPQTKCP